MSHLEIARQRPLFHEGPDWRQLNNRVREQLVDHLADMCVEIANAHAFPQSKDQEQSDDFEN